MKYISVVFLLLIGFPLYGALNTSNSNLNDQNSVNNPFSHSVKSDPFIASLIQQRLELSLSNVREQEEQKYKDFCSKGFKAFREQKVLLNFYDLEGVAIDQNIVDLKEVERVVNSIRKCKDGKVLFVTSWLHKMHAMAPEQRPIDYSILKSMLSSFNGLRGNKIFRLQNPILADFISKLIESKFKQRIAYAYQCEKCNPNIDEEDIQIPQKNTDKTVCCW